MAKTNVEEELDCELFNINFRKLFVIEGNILEETVLCIKPLKETNPQS